MTEPPRLYASHALLRYLQRVEKIDVELFDRDFAAMQRAGLPVNAVRAHLTWIAMTMRAVGASRLTIDGFAYVMDRGTLVTVISRNCRGFGVAGKGKVRKIAAARRRGGVVGAEQREAAE